MNRVGVHFCVAHPRTGGKAHFAETWQKQVEAFEDIREDLGNSYTVTHYPKPNSNEGFRRITIDPTRPTIRARSGASGAGRAIGRAACCRLPRLLER
jgi:hypothetical protein